MYRIKTTDKTLYTDAIRYVRLHKNGCYVECMEDVAEGICAKVHEDREEIGTVLTDTVFALSDGMMQGTEAVCTSIERNPEFTVEGLYKLERAKEEAAETKAQLTTVCAAALTSTTEACTQTNAVPKSNVGLFIMGAEDWEAGKSYNRFDLFRYNGVVGWVKQAHTSQETWLPFSVGTEALYGARPVPDDSGVYPYVYNMKVEVGMKVCDDGVVYECIQGTDELLYKPGQAPALFKVLE